MGGCCLQSAAMVADENPVPTGDGTIRDALLLVDQALKVGLLNGAQACAGWAGPGGFIE